MKRPDNSITGDLWRETEHMFQMWLNAIIALSGAALLGAAIYTIIKHHPAPFRNIYYVVLAVILFAIASGRPLDLQLSPSEGFKASTIDVQTPIPSDQAINSGYEKDVIERIEKFWPNFVLPEVAFGRPIFQTADELNLDIPPSITENLDVYWVEFAWTIRKINVDLIEEVSFVVDLENDAFTLDMIPRQFSKDFIDLLETTPVRGTAVPVSLGEFFGRKITFTGLQPEIVAFGFRERNFGWRVSGPALSSGSYKTIAILAVPKGAKALGISLSAISRITDRQESQIAVTRAATLKLELPNAAPAS